jgi:ubiquitin C-terminal hydrolase
MEQLKKYCKSGDLTDLSDIDYETSQFMLKQVPKVLSNYPDKSNFYHKRALQILEIFDIPPPLGSEEDCKKLYGLFNTGASCYLDSVLFSLFAIKNKFIDENMLYNDLKYDESKTALFGNFNCAKKVYSVNINKTKEIDLKNRKIIQENLRKIAESIRGNKDVEYCTDLRKSFKPCVYTEDFSETGMKDPAELLIFILKIFNLDKAVYEKVVYTTKFNINIYETELDSSNIILNVKEIPLSEKILRDENIVQFIDKTYLNNLDKKKLYYMSKFLTAIEAELKSGDITTIYTKKLYYSPYIIFHFERISIDQNAYNKMIKSGRVNLEKLPFVLNKVKIIPSMTITIGNGSRFQLSSVVIWKGYHYTCYFKCGLEWYYYDDIGSSIQYIGSYNKFLRSSPSPLTNGILYFYIPI